MQYETPTQESIEAKCQELVKLEGQLERKTKTLQRKIEALVEEQATKAGDLPDRIKALEDDIKRDCLLRGESVMTETVYDVIYSEGRVNWDKRGLEGYAVAHPELETFKKVGKPSAKLTRKKS